MVLQNCLSHVPSKLLFNDSIHNQLEKNYQVLSNLSFQCKSSLRWYRTPKLYKHDKEMNYVPYECILNLTNTSFLRRRHGPFRAVGVLRAWNDVPKNEFLFLLIYVVGNISAISKIGKIANDVKLNPFQANVLFLWPLKTSENL